MKIISAEFLKSAEQSAHYPEAVTPEIAFAGRSNAGKSSLINKLLNRKKLVKTSSTPGKTRLINFFLINNLFLFVDLPGYGYAKVPKSVKKKWGPMVEAYISQRETLKGVVIIMDIRRTPGPEDQHMFNWLDYLNIISIPVLTKIDKLSKTKQKKQMHIIAENLLLEENSLFPFSAKTGQGKDEIWTAIKKIL